MDAALDEARAAADRGEVPVGAVLVGPDGTIVAQAGNRTRELSDPPAHAETLVIRAACAAASSDESSIRAPAMLSDRPPAKNGPAEINPSASSPRAGSSHSVRLHDSTGQCPSAKSGSLSRSSRIAARKA